ncbi:uncharacterized protein N7518_006124 [Penicillium psychrosexuale]|uniref:uncharacterized protein n=1 Tax=Penicillium psychrosexuale TaxID=1002107 RepID=UPI002545AAF8|nr:uncharacterized protein N7518_006124 [Penicillium psychrosexuale]KAJ5789113.1 hypothetical protein N7518_006124 [Penicillium psychrosexuale]
MCSIQLIPIAVPIHRWVSTLVASRGLDICLLSQRGIHRDLGGLSIAYISTLHSHSSLHSTHT